LLLSEAKENQEVICVGVKDTSAEFLQYLDRQGIALGSKIKIVAIEPFDLSVIIKIDEKQVIVSDKTATNLYVKLG
jgi:DtxR family transcriptional regulator, Mn-dependent transcriptional regulator